MHAPAVLQVSVTFEDHDGGRSQVSVVRICSPLARVSNVACALALKKRTSLT